MDNRLLTVNVYLFRESIRILLKEHVLRAPLPLLQIRTNMVWKKKKYVQPIYPVELNIYAFSI